MLFRCVPPTMRSMAMSPYRCPSRVRPRARLRRPPVVSAKTVVEPSVVETETDSTETVPDDQLQYDYDPLTNQQIKKLISVVCEETRLAHVELELGSFKFRLRRNVLREQNGAHFVPSAENPALVTPLGDVKLERSLEDSFVEDDSMASIDESLMMIDSPKVGIFRNGAYNRNGKKLGPGPVEGDQVSAGQPLCAIEQLGTFTPILAPQQGEVLAFPYEDGEPIAYKDAVVEFAPYFGGHIVGDKKYA